MKEIVIFDGNTEFDHYIVVDEVYNDRPSRVLYSKDKIAAQSGVALDNKKELLFDYNERFMELIRGLNPRSMLIIGGGAFTLPIAINKDYPDMALDVVELDPGLVSIARDHFGFTPNENTRVHIGDGSNYLEKLDFTYDMIILDAYEQTKIPVSFQTPEVSRMLSNRLNQGGLVAMNIIASMHGVRSQVLYRIDKAMESSFSEIEVSPAGRESSLWIAQNFVLTAHDSPIEVGEHLSYGPVMTNARKFEDNAA